MENENTAISSPVEERISRQPEELSDSQQAKTEAPPPPDFLLPPTQVKPVPSPIRQSGLPPMDYPPPVPHQEVWQAGNGKPGKSNSALAVLAIIAIVTIVGCLALILIFDLLGFRSHWTGVLPVFSPDEATQMPMEPMEPPMEPPADPSPEPKAPSPSWPEPFSSLPEEPPKEEPPEDESRRPLPFPFPIVRFGILTKTVWRQFTTVKGGDSSTGKAMKSWNAPTITSMSFPMAMPLWSWKDFTDW